MEILNAQCILVRTINFLKLSYFDLGKKGVDVQGKPSAIYRKLQHVINKIILSGSNHQRCHRSAVDIHRHDLRLTCQAV